MNLRRLPSHHGEVSVMCLLHYALTRRIRGRMTHHVQDTKAERNTNTKNDIKSFFPAMATRLISPIQSKQNFNVKEKMDQQWQLE